MKHALLAALLVAVAAHAASDNALLADQVRRSEQTIKRYHSLPPDMAVRGLAESTYSV